MQQLSSIDAEYIYTEDRKLPMHVTTATIYDPSTAPQGKVRLKQIMGVFERAVYNVPMFRQRLVEVPLGLDAPYWADDPDFDIEYHVRHVALPKPGDWRQFYIQVARINTPPLDRNRPLWEVYVVEGLRNLEGVPAGSFALVMKLHYAALNGEALRSLFQAINTSEPEAPPSNEHLNRTLYRDVRRGNLPLLFNAAQHTVKRSFNSGKVVTEVLRGYRRIQQARKQGEIKPTPPAPRTRFNAPLSPHRVVTSYTVPYQRARELKATVAGLSLNELALAVIGGALRHYLDAKAELPEESLVAQAPISGQGGENGAPYDKKVTTANVALGTEIADPLERLHAVHEASNNARNYLHARGELLLENLNDAMHPYVARGMQQLQENLGNPALLTHLYPARPNTLVRNLPGPLETVYLCGAKIVTSMGFGPCMPEVGLFHTITTAAGQVTIAVNACRTTMPDPTFYRQCLKQSWTETEAALQAKM